MQENQEGRNWSPQQGDSNLGWVGGHKWGLSWRDRPPARPPAQLCVTATQAHHVIATQGHCVIATQKLFLFNTEAHCFGVKINQKSKVGLNGSPCHRFEHLDRGN